MEVSSVAVLDATPESLAPAPGSSQESALKTVEWMLLELSELPGAKLLGLTRGEAPKRHEAFTDVGAREQEIITIRVLVKKG